MKVATVARNIFIGVLVFFAAFLPAIWGKCSFHQTSPSSIIIYASIITFVLSCWTYHPINKERRLRTTASILAFFVSQFVTLGSFFKLHHHYWCFGNLSDAIIWAIQSIIYSFVAYQIILRFYSFIDKQRETEKSPHINLVFWFIVIILVRLFFLAAFYPCVFGFDAAVGLRTYLDSDCATCTHHPFFIQLIHGIAFNIGQNIGHLSIGFAILSLILIVASSAIIIYGVKLFELSKVKRGWILATIIIYAVFPLYPYLSVYPTKDGIFAYAFLLYLFTLYEILLSKGECFRKQKFFWLYFIGGLIVCLSRHQGSIIFMIESVLLLIAYRTFWKQIFVCSFPVILLSLSFSKIIIPLYNIEPAGKQETYGTLFQQTAYCLKQFQDDVTESELAAINRVLNTDTITKKYEFEKTDAVKNTYKYNPWYRVTPGSPSMFRHIDRSAESEDLKAYRKAWFSMFLRHPYTHIEASAAVFGGFFFNNGQPLILAEPKWAENTSATTEEYRFWHVNKIAKIIQDNNYFITQKPVISWFGSIPYYNWCALLLLSVLFYRKNWMGLISFLPLLLSIGVLLICPVAFGRYVFPIVMALPLLFYYLLSPKQ